MDFKGCDRKFDWLEISLVCDKSDKHLMIYDRYNDECAAQEIRNFEQVNISEAYSVTDTIKFDPSNDTQEHMLWKQLVAWHCKGYNAAPVSDYINKPIFHKLPLENDYFRDESDERVYIGLRDSLGYTNKMRLRIWEYTNGEYLYVLVDNGLTIKYKTYTIKLQEMRRSRNVDPGINFGGNRARNKDSKI